MEEYEEIAVGEAYTLQNAGGLVLVCTKGRAEGNEEGGKARYDLAPVAWCCPLDYEPVSRILFVCDTGHRTYEDLCASGEFVLALPSFRQKELVEKTGSVSGRDVDKYARFGIPAFGALRVDALVPEGVAGWLECRLASVAVEGTSAIVAGEVLRACARHEAWRERLHYVRDGVWFAPGKNVG